ncbi:MAG TPA: hypothetical protein VK876_04110, partial [Rubrivivax sp.]|nr:hypothetical protein [Rubrivivax sp.]
PAWTASIEWCAVLADLPALQHLARGGAAWPWMADDPRLRAMTAAGDAGDSRKAGLPDAQALRVLLDVARAGPQDLLLLWRAEWRSRLPAAAASQGIDNHLLPLLAQHARAFAAPQAADGWALRRHLQSRLVLLLRRMLVEPVTAFVYLALSALECERLRGELVRRATFPRGGAAP